ncbi:GNAT family N-acetyltransferase [Ammoniphilus sp. YIM 78166]|uniref:GNAT family N-acetyltransferase n=1 Tax=Ammoniphilus sp. YIM 78166 TaxID=1644106 RepID=UPI00106FA733|nr:GNAT family N-acetyltransferase [Ammoniphilus sp. YIM 78166]
MSISIQAAEEKDLAKIHRVIHLAHAKNRRNGYYFPISRISQRNLLLRMRRDQFYVLRYHDEIIGTVALRRRNHSLEICSLTVLDQYRGQGFGKKLLTFAENKAKASGWSRVMLQTLKQHATLRAFYQRSGYRPLPGSRNRRGKWIALYKTLPSAVSDSLEKMK